MSSLDVAVIGNCTLAAIIDRQADIVWSCFPHFAGEPVLYSLLDGARAENDAGDGVFAITLENMTHCEQAYIENTPVLVSTLSDKDGNVLEITDFAPRFEQYGRMFRPPMLIRRVRPVHGRPRISVKLKPRFGWGEEKPELTRGSNHIRFVGSEQALRLTTDISVSYVLESTPFLLDRPTSFFFGSDEALRASVETSSREFLERTIDHWRGWVRSLSIPFEWQDAVIRAAISLKLCNFEESGAIVAALTSSIPEAPGTQRNWDYRYCWLRDAYFVIHALNRLGVTRTMEDYITYINNLVADSGTDELQPLYGINRAAILDERVATNLAGYQDMGPVRVGNAAYLQRQNDVYGSVILAVTHTFFDRRMIRPANLRLFEELERLGERAAAAFDQPDAGPWELRTMAAVHTFSSAMCWAACDRLAKIAGALGLDDRRRYWRDEAERLHATIVARTWNADLNSFVSTFDGEDLDATLLLLHELDFLPASDPRIVATIEAVGRELQHDGLLYRYKVRDDFGQPETAFLICTFWYVDALNAIGRTQEARDLFTRALSLRNSFGLLAEDVDFKTGALWGNFPQAYSMVGLINSATLLSRRWEDAF